MEGHNELQDYLRRLALPRSEPDVNFLEARSEVVHLTRQYLLTSPSEAHARDAFRHLGGFQILISVLEDIKRHASEACTDTEKSFLLEIFQTVFAILATTFQGHDGNRRYFRERVHSNGWLRIRDILAPSINEAAIDPEDFGAELLERGLGCLLACSLDDESLITFFKPAGTRIVVDSEDTSSISFATTGSELPNVTDHITQSLGKSAHISLADPLLVMLEVRNTLKEQSSPQHITIIIPKLLSYLAGVSVHNLQRLYDTGMLSLLLSGLTSLSRLPAGTNEEIYKLAKDLLGLGCGNLKDARSLYRNARSSPLIAELLLSSLNSCTEPSFVHFDLSFRGYASIELPQMAHSFPPVSNTNGYTLSLWFQVKRFDPDAHTTLFGAFDASQTCFVLVYLEKDTHSLILQTSIKSTRPSVRFKSTSFREGRWYHMALLHRRPKTTSSSKASLFVNGDFVEQVKSQYPSLPAKDSTNPRTHEITTTNSSRDAVQAFLGTPQDLAFRLGKNIVKTQWQLASAQLISETLSDDLIAVYFRLGPRYAGNFQDCLGSFQTYEASAQLNLRNEGLHPGREEKSELVTAIRSKAGDLLPEAKMIFNFSAINIYDNVNLHTTEIELLLGLSKKGHRNYLHFTQGGHNPIAVNGAYPSFDQSLLQSSGHAVLTGEPTVITKSHTDNAAWQMGGCTAVVLALLDSTDDINSLVLYLHMFFAAIKNDWRNSEAVERDNGFGVLASILSAKLKKLDIEFVSRQAEATSAEPSTSCHPSLRCLNIILEFVGYRVERPEESMINNPLAYRILLVDPELWRQLSSEVQKAYYEQFVAFAVHSNYHAFNSKRLSRMSGSQTTLLGNGRKLILTGVVKNWIDALNYQYFNQTTFSYFLSTFRTLVMKNFTAEIMRSLALYITYAVYEPERLLLEASKRRGTSSRATTPTRRKTVSVSTPGDASPNCMSDGNSIRLDRIQVAMGVFEAYTEMLCQKNDKAIIDRFARTVTNKVREPLSIIFKTNKLIVAFVSPCRCSTPSHRICIQDSGATSRIKWPTIHEKVRRENRWHSHHAALAPTKLGRVCTMACLFCNTFWERYRRC